MQPRRKLGMGLVMCQACVLAWVPKGKGGGGGGMAEEELYKALHAHEFLLPSTAR
jgi:hypothetical protein